MHLTNRRNISIQQSEWKILQTPMLACEKTHESHNANINMVEDLTKDGYLEDWKYS